MREERTRERRRAVRHPSDPHYDAFTDRRQPLGVVASYVRVCGGELCRSRVHYLHLARVLAAKLSAVGTIEWTTPTTYSHGHAVRAAPRALPVVGTITWEKRA